jgi:hypothetical protein
MITARATRCDPLIAPFRRPRICDDDNFMLNLKIVEQQLL